MRVRVRGDVRTDAEEHRLTDAARAREAREPRELVEVVDDDAADGSGELANIASTGVDLVITDNPGCLTHLRGAYDSRRDTVRVRHLAEVLWDSLQTSV